MAEKFVLFQPGEYQAFEQEDVAYRQKIASGELPIPPMPFPMPPAAPIAEAEILAYNALWNPLDPLYNDPAYARAHGHPSVPAYPGFRSMFPMGMPAFPHDYASKFYYTMDRNDYRYTRCIYAGDLLHDGDKHLFMNDLTLPDGTARVWEMGGEGVTLDQNDKPVILSKGNVLEGYSLYADDAPRMSFSDNMAEWTKYFPPARYTSDEDYAHMKTLWDQEMISDDRTPCWEDVSVGQELPKTCSDGPITYMHMMYYYNIGKMSIYSREELLDPKVRAVTFRDRYGAFLDETALHFTGRNIPGMRGVLYNDTAARLIARTLTNFVGNRGRVSRFGWGLFPFFKELRVRPIDAEMFEKVPGMAGCACNRHGAEGDTVIGRAVITDKFVNDAGEHCCEVALWAENLDGDIIQTCPSEIVLPTRG